MLAVVVIISLLASVAFAAETSLSSKNTFSLTESEKLWLRAHPIIHVRISPSYPPFEFYKDGRYQGLAVDYLDLVAKRLGISFEPVDASLSWSESLNRLRKKSGVDLILMITRTAERERDIEFSRTFISFPLVIFSRKDSPFISGIHDLRSGKTVVEKDYTYRGWLKRDVPEAELTEAGTSREALKAVSTGSADFWIANLAMGSYLIETEGLVNLKVAAPTPYDKDDLAMGVRKDWPELAHLINRALDSVTEEETRAIHNHWLSVRYEHGIQIKDVVFWILLVSLFVAAISFLFIVQLRRQVKSRTAHLEKEIVERVQAEEALERSRSQYQSLVDNIPIGVNLMDTDYRIVMSNEIIGRWFSKDRDLIIGQYCFHEFKKREEPCLQCPGIVSMKSGKLAIAETEGIRDDGSRFAVRLRTVPVGPAESPTGFIELVEDMTDIMQAQEERSRLEQQLIQSQKMEAIGTLAGGIAHDFNNILTPIVGYTQMAQRLAKEDVTLSAYLEHVVAAASRATELVRQILTFSRKDDQQKMALQISSIAQESLKLLRSSIPTTIEIREDITTQALIFANPTQIHQIIMNLCTNAYQAMELTGGILMVSLKETEILPGQITGDEVPPGRYVVLEVSDTGCGMDEETKTKIFEPYFTSKEKGKGTGLGLAVVHGIVKDLQGQIAVLSEPGRGTTFRIFLPLVKEGGTEALPQKQVKMTATERHERILFVDDEESISSMAKDYLMSYGYAVEVCSNGSDALLLFGQNPKAYDLLITDMSMPGMNGKDLSQRVLALRPDLPIILCTGYSSLVDREKAVQIGIRDYAEKPVDLSDLLGRITRVLSDSGHPRDPERGDFF
ncbi:MAG: transporter substrate-binding domain-containing protein [Desulfocapsaceae bacterium]|nr:transporter substrate-binding domain-containing protein [Desulfocapsaceae bacterium]